MPSAYTPLLGFVLPVTGELPGTWGAAVNTKLTDLVEASIAGYSTNSLSAGDWTLTTTGGGLAAEYRSAILIATGTTTPTGTTRYIYAPESSKTYVVINNMTGNSSVYLCGGTSTSHTIGVEIESGSSALCAWDSNPGDFIKVAGGGGGASGGGADQIFFENDLVVTTSYTLPPGKNAGTFGPVSINSGVEVTVPTGQVWSIV
jgi:hypothetical protein